MAEWVDKYNPFNSMKALVHADKFEAILAGKPRPPIVVNFDLTNLCNYNCRFCMFGGRKRADNTSETFRHNHKQLPSEYIATLPKLWKEWDIKAECVGGGGDGTMHPYCLQHIVDSHEQGIDVGFVTNGYLVNSPRWWDTLVQTTKWTGFSIDAGNAKDYSEVKGVNPRQFEVVLNNLRGLAEAKKRLNAKCNIGYKFLLDDKNYNSIFEAAEKAKMVGCNTFQFRPAINDYKYDKHEIHFIEEQIKNAQEFLEDDNFHVYGVTHKFNPDFTKKHQFGKCRATMLTTTWCADGGVYMCTDTRGNPWAKLIDHYPNPQRVIDYWGSPEHFKAVDGINFQRDCDRCTLAAPNEMFEQVFMQDKMERNLI
jgi:cyclic pyranopterin phosphate synthase